VAPYGSLIGMLDCERSTIEEYASPGERHYPAIHELNHLKGGGEPCSSIYLIHGVEATDSEVKRANAPGPWNCDVPAVPCVENKNLKREGKTSTSLTKTSGY
jgi:hypothetical protein